MDALPNISPDPPDSHDAQKQLPARENVLDLISFYSEES